MMSLKEFARDYLVIRDSAGNERKFTDQQLDQMEMLSSGEWRLAKTRHGDIWLKLADKTEDNGNNK